MGNEEPRAAAIFTRRSGLGRGLGAVIATAVDEPAPAHLHQGAGRARSITVMITEDHRGTQVNVTDAEGRSAAVTTAWTERELRQATITAVARVLDAGSVTLISEAVQTIDETEIASVLLELEDGRRLAGSSVVTGTVTFAVAAAAMAALDGGRG